MCKLLFIQGSLNGSLFIFRIVVIDETNLQITAYIGTEQLELTKVEESRIKEATSVYVDNIPWEEIAAEQINHCSEYEGE